jgi:hypothetical protein
LVLLCVLAFSPLSALARAWTDYQGRKVEGDFVRVLEGKVELKAASGKTIQVEFGHLSADDQDFVREQLKAQGLGDQVPAKKADESGSTTKPKSSEKEAAPAKPVKPGPPRIWTDVAGHRVQGRFVSMDGGKVVLIVKEKKEPYPFDKFSPADQKYVREEMTARGEGDKVPAEAPAVNANPAAAPQIAQAAPVAPRTGPITAPRATFPTMPSLPKITFPTFTPPTRSAPVQPPAFTPPVPPPIVHAPAPIIPPPVPTFVPDNQPAFQQVAVKKCSNCGAILPNNITAGDHCPHCGVLFQYDEVTGKRAYWAYFAAPPGVGAVIGLIIYAIRRSRST